MTIEIETHISKEYEVNDLVGQLRRLVVAYDNSDMGGRSAMEGDAERICDRLAELGVDVVEVLAKKADSDTTE